MAAHAALVYPILGELSTPFVLSLLLVALYGDIDLEVSTTSHVVDVIFQNTCLQHVRSYHNF